MGGEILDDDIPRAAEASGREVVQRKWLQDWGRDDEVLVTDVIAPEIDPELEIIPATDPAEVIDELVLCDIASLREEKAQGIERSQTAIRECQGCSAVRARKRESCRRRARTLHGKPGAVPKQRSLEIIDLIGTKCVGLP